jgi:ribosome-associated protein
VTSEALATEICRQAAEKKALDIRAIDLRGVVGYTDFFVICTGNTERQTKAIHDGVLAGIKQEHALTPRRVEGLTRSSWILMDYLAVVVHVFTPATPVRVFTEEAQPVSPEAFI